MHSLSNKYPTHWWVEESYKQFHMVVKIQHIMCPLTDMCVCVC